jgi:hypothetical protein
MVKQLITKDMSVMFVARDYPGTRPIFEKYGIPWRDQRVPQWMSLVQPAAQHGIWYEDGFVQELRQAIPQDDPLQQLDDLALVHERIRLVAAVYPQARALFERYQLPCVDSPVPPWEPIEQAAAAHGVWPVESLVQELNQATTEGAQP